MKAKTLLFIAFICSFIGALFFLIQRRWVIIYFPTLSPHKTIFVEPTQQTTHKTVAIYFSKKGTWKHENLTIIWDQDTATRNIVQLLKQWLIVLYDEHIITHHVSLESVAVSPMSNEAYISFDRSFLSPDMNIAQKWMIIESLFKTIIHNGLTLQTLMLLVHHAPMVDDHLDFSQPLPIQERF